MAIYTNLYKPFIESEERITRRFVKPLEIYRISTYKYVDGEIKSLAGINSALIFSIGIFEEKDTPLLHCIKLTEIRPDYFIKLLKKLKHKALTSEQIDESNFLYDVLIPYGSDKTGRTIYNRTISKLTEYKYLKRIADPYRTYDVNGIRYMQRVNLKKDFLKDILL